MVRSPIGSATELRAWWLVIGNDHPSWDNTSQTPSSDASTRREERISNRRSSVIDRFARR